MRCLVRRTPLTSSLTIYSRSYGISTPRRLACLTRFNGPTASWIAWRYILLMLYHVPLCLATSLPRYSRNPLDLGLPHSLTLSALAHPSHWRFLPFARSKWRKRVLSSWSLFNDTTSFHVSCLDSMPSPLFSHTRP